MEEDLANGNKYKLGMIQLPNPPKIELTVFNDENSREWLRKCHKFFVKNQVREEHKLDVVEMYIEGNVDTRFQGIKLEKPKLNWGEFSEMLYKRFGDRNFQDVEEEFNKLQQTSTDEQYQERFEELKSLMLIRNPLLNETYFISSFISGLKEEIKPMVKMLCPTSLTKAFEIAYLHEQACGLHHQQMQNIK